MQKAETRGSVLLFIQFAGTGGKLNGMEDADTFQPPFCGLNTGGGIRSTGGQAPGPGPGPGRDRRGGEARGLWSTGVEGEPEDRGEGVGGGPPRGGGGSEDPPQRDPSRNGDTRGEGHHAPWNMEWIPLALAHLHLCGETSVSPSPHERNQKR